MKTALIGFTGFVGGNLDRQHTFTHKYNSKNIHEIVNESFDLIACAAIPAVKWWANQNPEEDKAKIDELLKMLSTVSANKFILISTIDVYPNPSSGDENSKLGEMENHAYGKNRLYAESFVKETFKNSLIVRLPGLFGEGLKKNVIFDLLNDNFLENINPDSSFQYYSLDKLWKDVQIALENNITLMNFATEPIRTKEIIDRFFPNKRYGEKMGQETHYGIRSIHADIFKGKNGYLYDKTSVLKELEAFIKNYKKS